MAESRDDPTPGPRMQQRCAQFTAAHRAGRARLLAGEHVGAFLVTLPKSSARQRAALLTYAVEDRIAAPIDSVSVVQGPAVQAGTGQVLALVCAKKVLAEHEQDDARLLPEFLMIPAPEGTAPAWAVWREGARAVVRANDGTGFAAPVGLLPLLWSRAGKPELTALADALPEGMPARDLSGTPPPPHPADIAFGFGINRGSQRRSRRFGTFAAAVVVLAGLLTLGFLAADTLALSRLTDRARADAQAAIAGPLPGITLTSDTGPILARLAPPPPQAQRGDFLPLLNDVTGALAALETDVTFRRLTWGGQDGALVVLAQTAALEDLQGIQRGLEAQGFTVRSGAASAGDGGAEAELRITRGGT